MVLMIGLSLIKVGIIDFGGGFSAMSSGTFGKYENIGLGLLVLCVIVAFNCSRSPLLRMSGIAIGLMVGYAVALMLGMVDFSALENLPLITVPIPFKYGFSFDFHAFMLAGTIYLLSVLEAVGTSPPPPWSPTGIFRAPSFKNGSPAAYWRTVWYR